MNNLKIEALYVYPVKSLAGVKVESLNFDHFGPQFDRRWMIVDEVGNCLTQREITLMALIKVTFDNDFLHFSYNKDTFKLPHNGKKSPMIAKVWKHRGEMLDCGDQVAKFLSTILDVKCRLVTIDDQHERISSGENAAALSLVDTRQLLITSHESLVWLNQKLIEQGEAAILMNRFRANIVVSGGSGIFYEDRWQRLSIGEINLTREKICGRCAVITTDQEKGQLSSNRPLKILAQYNRTINQKGATFGTYFNSQNVSGTLYCQDIIEIKQ